MRIICIFVDYIIVPKNLFGGKKMDNGTLAFSRYINGDSDAFAEIVDNCNEKLIFYINRFVNDLDVSEEIAADCFVELIVHPKRFKFRSSILTYLFSIAHNKCVNYIRRNSKIKKVPLSECENISKEYKAFEDEIAKNESYRMLNAALNEINNNYREALHLLYFEELSYEDIAKVMNKTVKQIDNYCYRGKIALKLKLEEWGFLYEE